MNRDRLSAETILERLRELDGWELREGKLHRDYSFKDFTHAFGFMAASATVIEKMDHHPEWFNVYGKVRIDIWTHSSGGVTEVDLKLAGALEALAGRLL